ncbi:MAG: cyclic nucleotide-binding domain-containing protein [Ilumatobacter sp.]|nr:cyclic nucleotide-binding domain-containing protein [Ilumatobacter sp.]|tara:strand:+ start:2025 stop:2447 length:423 start_codon:yes stop_codon:yes gene_type:complete
MTTNTTIAALASIELFTGLSKKELAAIDRLMTPIDIKAGKEVIKEGTAGREAFIIVEGTASVWREGRLIASVGSGAVLGEVALLANRTRTATVKAETAMTVEVLNRREFEQLLDQSPAITRKLLVATAKRVHQLEPSMLS